MKSTPLPILSLCAILFVAPLVHGQIAPNEPAVLSNTTLGQSQNDERDLANSLVAGPQKYGKGEKKLQVSAAELKSKSIKDGTFGGSLLNEGIDPAQPKLDAAKEHAAPSEEKPSARTASTGQTSSASQQSTEHAPRVTGEPRVSESDFSFSNLSQTATLADQLTQSDVAAAPEPASQPSKSSANPDAQKKDQDGSEKPSTKTSTDKSSGDH